MLLFRWPVNKPVMRNRITRRLGALISSIIISVATLSAAAQPNSTQAGRWNCKANPGSDGWDCSPIEALPGTGVLFEPNQQSRRGARSAKGADNRGTYAQNEYARLDWVTVEQMSDEQREQAPTQCTGAYIEPDYIEADLRGVDPDTQPIIANSIESETNEAGVSTLTGDVVVQQGYRQISSNQATIDRDSGKARFTGESKYREPGILLIGQDTEVDMDAETVTISNAEFVSHEANLRGTAKLIEGNAQNQILVRDGEVTRCEPGVNTWALRGKSIELDREKGVGTVRHATLRIKNVPVLYTPYLRFPIDDRRKSGFLFPQIGSSDDGLDIAVPYYFNIAENYDATVTPRFISDRGPGLELETRFLKPNQSGELGGAYLLDDDEFNDNDRWLVSFDQRGFLFDSIRTSVDYAAVSDEDYFSDLGGGLNVSSQTHLLRIAEANWRNDWLNVTTRLQGYQTLDEIITDENRPYDRLPQVLANLNYLHEPTGLQFRLNNEFAYFDRENRNLTGLAAATGSRVSVSPEVSWNLEWPFAYIRPTAQYRFIRYDLDDLDLNLEDSPELSVPTYSLDTGVFFERELTWRGAGLTQTFEPRLFYLKTPFEDQTELPDFDTSELTFGYNQLFRKNRFVGGDRIGDAEHLSVGLTTRFIEKSGFERLRASIGQIYYFDDRCVALTGNPCNAGTTSENFITSTTSQSAYVAEVQFALRSGWRMLADIEYDAELERTNKSSFSLRYQSDNNHIFNIGYRTRQDRQEIEQTDISFIWPLGQRWKILARWNQDLSESRVIEALAGIEYDSCCWSVRLVGRKWINDDDLFASDLIEERRAIYLQFQFKGLAGVGHSLEGILSDSIFGYREKINGDFFRR